jgi:hypothetical protein
MPVNQPQETVAQILRRKLGSIKQARLPPGSPSWDDIRHLTWAEVVAAKDRSEAGFKTFHKLLTDKRFDK